MTTSTAHVPATIKTVLSGFEHIRNTAPHNLPVFVDETYTCDHGAVVLAHLCNKYGIPNTLEIGEYVHTNLDTLIRIRGGDEYVDSLNSNEYETAIAEEANCSSEHHHWVVAHLPGGDVILDPNGPIRNEPYAQPATNAAYQPFELHDPERTIMFEDPDMTPWEIAQIELEDDGEPFLAEVLTIIDNL